MADVPEQRVKVSLEETYFLGGTTESLLSRYAAAINWIANNVRPQPIGTVVYSRMTEVQFQAVRGPGWILADGRNIVGSALHALTGQTTANDCRGVFIRAANNGRSDGNQNPDGTAVGGYQADALKAHTHPTTAPQRLAKTNGTLDVTEDDGGVGARRNADPAFFSLDVSVNNSGGSQTRPIYRVANAFQRIN